jgi:hypothetical protein
VSDDHGDNAEDAYGVNEDISVLPTVGIPHGFSRSWEPAEQCQFGLAATSMTRHFLGSSEAARHPFNSLLAHCRGGWNAGDAGSGDEAVDAIQYCVVAEDAIVADAGGFEQGGVREGRSQPSAFLDRDVTVVDVVDEKYRHGESLGHSVDIDLSSRESGHGVNLANEGGGCSRRESDEPGASVDDTRWRRHSLSSVIGGSR